MEVASMLCWNVPHLLVLQLSAADQAALFSCLCGYSVMHCLLAGCTAKHLATLAAGHALFIPVFVWGVVWNVWQVFWDAVVCPTVLGWVADGAEGLTFSLAKPVRHAVRCTRTVHEGVVVVMVEVFLDFVSKLVKVGEHLLQPFHALLPSKALIVVESKGVSKCYPGPR